MNTIKDVNKPLLTQWPKKENKGILSLTQQDAPFQDSGAPETPQVYLNGTSIALDMYL